MSKHIRQLLIVSISLFPIVGITGMNGDVEATGPSGSAIPLRQQPAEITSAATSAMMLDAAKAGSRMVAVGDHGIVLLSDDDGKSFRQAKSVPVRSTLTAVTFVDDKNGWAVGHWGTVLKTADGGETWVQQRLDTAVDQPLFSVFFKNQWEGWAVGLWSIVLTTKDGGATWTPTKIPAPPNGGKSDKNLYKIFSTESGGLVVAAEQGTVLRSGDKGTNWSYVQTDSKGSFWTGCKLSHGTLLVAGLRGTIYRSTDEGQSWKKVTSPSSSSITSCKDVNGRVEAVGLDGALLESDDNGLTFKLSTTVGRPSYTAVLHGGDGRTVRFSKQGVHVNKEVK